MCGLSSQLLLQVCLRKQNLSWRFLHGGWSLGALPGQHDGCGLRRCQQTQQRCLSVPQGCSGGQGCSFPFPRTWTDDFVFSPCKLLLEGAVPLGKQASAVQRSFQMERKRPH